MRNTLLGKIASEYDGLSKSHKKIADYILENYDKAAYMTACSLGESTDISESTVVRFATYLGFEGYPEFQKKLQENIKNKLTAIQRVNLATDRFGKDTNILSGVLANDINMIRQTEKSLSYETLKQAAKLINEANKIYILGVRSSACLAGFMSFYLSYAYDDVILIDSNSDSEIFEQSFKITPNDVCVAISFPRYSKQTIKALDYISSKSANIIAITDSESSPIASYAEITLTAKSNMASFVDSLVAPMSVINALIVEATKDKKSKLLDTFETLEEVWEKYHIYEEDV